jgi:hypothetical protein
MANINWEGGDFESFPGNICSVDGGGNKLLFPPPRPGAFSPGQFCFHYALADYSLALLLHICGGWAVCVRGPSLVYGGALLEESEKSTAAKGAVRKVASHHGATSYL